MKGTFVIAFALAAVACTSSANQPTWKSPPPSVTAGGLDATYSTGPIRFRYPSAWTAQNAEGRYVSTFSTPMVDVSNQPLGNQCTGTSGISQCHVMPVGSLDPGGVVLQWSENGFPGWKFGSQGGRAITIDGRPAKISNNDPVCGSLSADRSLSVVVKMHDRSNWYQLDGCFRDPGADAAVAEVMDLLQSVQISGR